MEDGMIGVRVVKTMSNGYQIIHGISKTQWGMFCASTGCDSKLLKTYAGACRWLAKRTPGYKVGSDLLKIYNLQD
jgi:hypothetical protein